MTMTNFREFCSHPHCYRPPEIGSEVCSDHVGPGVRDLLVAVANERDAALARVADLETAIDAADKHHVKCIPCGFIEIDPPGNWECPKCRVAELESKHALRPMEDAPHEMIIGESADGSRARIRRSVFSEGWLIVDSPISFEPVGWLPPPDQSGDGVS